MKIIPQMLTLVLLSGCASTKTESFGSVNSTSNAKEFTAIEVPIDFVITPQEVFNKYSSAYYGTYYWTFHVDDNFYYIVPDHGIGTFGIPEKSASIVIDGRTGQTVKNSTKTK